MEHKFILFLSFLFLLVGIFTIEPLMVLAGITILLFLIFDYIYNREERKNFKVYPVNKVKFAIILGPIDLILGGLLLLEVVFGIIPNIIIVIFAFLLMIKAFPFAIGRDIASIVDIFCSFFIIVFFVELSSILVIGISIYLIQKGVLSLF